MSPGLLRYHVFVTESDGQEKLWVSHYDFDRAVKAVKFTIRADMKSPTYEPNYQYISVTAEDDSGQVHEILRFKKDSEEPIIDNRPVPALGL